jgi:hypothetical protein
MKNTLIVNREYISDAIVSILSMPAGLASIETIDNGHSYVINFNPNKEEINKFKDNMKALLVAKSVDISNVDRIIDGLIISNLTTFYSRVYSALMNEILSQFVKQNLGKNFSISELSTIISKL